MGQDRPRVPRVAIFGAGPAGLAAAHAITSRHSAVECDLYEARNRVGGVVSSSRDGGFLYEAGPNSMNAKYPAVYNLIHEDLQLTSRVRHRSPAAKSYFVVHDGVLRPVPLSLPALLFTPILTPMGKVRILLEPFVPKLKQRVSADHESVGDFFRRRFGIEVSERLVDPFIAGVYASKTAKLSVKYAFHRLWQLERKSGSVFGGLLQSAFARPPSTQKNIKISGKELKASFSFDEGLQVLTDTLFRRLKNVPRVHFKMNRRIRSLDKDNKTGLWGVNYGRHQYDAVISTLPAHAVGDVTSNDEEVIRVFKEMKHRIQYAPVAVVALGFKREQLDHKLDGFGFLVPTRENRDGLLGVSFSSSIYPDRTAREGDVLLTAYVGGSRFPEKALMPSKQVISLASRHIQNLVGSRERKLSPSFSRVKLWSQGIPQYDALKYETAIVEMRISEVASPGFFLAGNYRDGVGLPDALLSGMNAAGRTLTYISSRPTADAENK